MKNKVFQIIAIVILIVISILFLKYLRKAEFMSSKYNSLEIKYNSLENEYYYMVNRITYNLDTNEKVTDANGNYNSFSTFSDHAYFIVRIHETNCLECIKEERENLLQLAENIGIKNILIFGRFQNIRYLKMYKEKLDLPFRIYKLQEVNLGINKEIDYENKPYLFLLSKNHVSSLYFPGIIKSKYSDNKYYKSIEQIFQKIHAKK